MREQYEKLLKNVRQEEAGAFELEIQKLKQANQLLREENEVLKAQL